MITISNFLAADIAEARLRAKLKVTTWMDTIRVAQKSNACQGLFNEVKTYCLFIGYPRSGHSLISSLIDAHPCATMAHRLNSLSYLQAGYSDKEVFYLALRNSQRFAQTGRQLTGYQYHVPQQWQGEFQKLSVIGDQEGKGTTECLAGNIPLLSRLMEKQNGRAQFSTRFIHVIRNPFDNISTWATRLHRSLAYTSDRYFALCRRNRWIKAHVAPEYVLDIRHEIFLDDPEAGLRNLCRYLQLEISDSYLADCVNIVYQSPHKSRHRAAWTPDLIKRVQHQINQISFLEGYSYEC